MATAPIQTVAAPGGTLSYSGNPDFRGYLAAQAANGNALASAALSAVGNAPTTGNTFAPGNGVNEDFLANYATDLNGEGNQGAETAKVNTLLNYINSAYGTYNNLTTTPSTTTTNAPADAAISGQASSALDTALQALDASNASVAASEGQQENELASNKATQQNAYGNTLTADSQGLTNAETGAKTQGNSDITSLDRLIASMGGGGSSVETQEVPSLVDRSVASNIAGADTTKATNDQSANVAWNTFLNQLGSQQQQLEDQAGQQEATNMGAYNKTAQALQAIKSAAQSGSIDPSDLSYELESAVGSIPAVVNWTPSFSGTTPVYQTPSLSNFTLSPTQIAAASGVALPTSGADTIPFLAALTGNNQQQKTTAPATA